MWGRFLLRPVIIALTRFLLLEASDENAKHVDDDETMTRLADLSWTSSDPF